MHLGQYENCVLEEIFIFLIQHPTFWSVGPRCSGTKSGFGPSQNSVEGARHCCGTERVRVKKAKTTMRPGRLRIIAGFLKGRWLELDAGDAVRPTSNRVREALFSRLGDLGEKRILDLYAGSGALGIEALSRGAAHATFVDCSPKVVALLKKNLATLGLVDHSEVFLGEALKILPRLGRDRVQFDLVFLDPPYAGDELRRILSALMEAKILALGAQVVLESARPAIRKTATDAAKIEIPDQFLFLDSHVYGDTVLTRFRFALVCATALDEDAK